MKRLIIIAACMLLASCARNEIKLSNQGVKAWQEIKLTAGGHAFELEQLKGGASKTFRFSSQKEVGGELLGKLDGQPHTSSFGYFTPNLSTRHDIILNDQGAITITAIP